jgi:hypothetical protein
LLNSNQGHSVSPIELSTLNADLAAMRLQLNLFENEKAKSEFAKKTLQEDVVRMKSLLDQETKARNQMVADNLLREEKAKAELVKLRAESARLKQALGKAKSAKDDSLLESLQAEKDANSKKITDLNNLLQEANKIKADNYTALKRYQDQLLRLTNELNTVSAASATRANLGTFAQVAQKAGKASVDLMSGARTALSAKAKWLLTKAQAEDPENVASRAYWLNAILKDMQSYKGMKPFAILLDGVYDDIKVVEYKSRQQFKKVVDNMIEFVAGQRDLTVMEVEAWLDDLDTRKIKLKKSSRTKGMETLQDYIAASLNPTKLQREDLDVSESVKDAFMEKQNTSELFRGYEKRTADRPPTPEFRPADGSEPRRSLYQWVRSIVTAPVRFLNQKGENLDPDKSPVWRFRSWLIGKVGEVGAVFAAPFVFFNWLTCSWF